MQVRGYIHADCPRRHEITRRGLRTRSTDVDTSIVSRSEWRARYEANPTYQIAVL